MGDWPEIPLIQSPTRPGLRIAVARRIYMNRYLGLSGALHVGLVAGLLYLGAKNDFSPHKLIESFTLQTGGETTAEAAPVAETAEVSGAGSSAVIDDSFVNEALSEMAPQKAVQKQAATGFKSAPKMKAKSSSAKANSATGENQDEKISGKSNQKNSLENNHEQSEQKIDSTTSEQFIGAETETSEDQSSAETEGRQDSVEKESFAAAATEQTAKSSEKNETQTETQNQEALSEQEEKQILAQKKALLEDLRRQNAEKEAQEAAAFAALAKSSQSDSGKEAGVAAEGSGGVAAEGSGGPAAGETVHALADFKQTAGNPKPRYDREDRMKNRSGTVTFQAFVKKDGSLDEFQMIESSGHRTLDAKTLKALKQWKFAAGQQGWIEIPFRWDLKGGVQEMPSLRSSMKE